MRTLAHWGRLVKDAPFSSLRRQDGKVFSFSDLFMVEGYGGYMMMAPGEARHISRGSIHRSAWKGYSANFALTEFSEVGSEVRLVASCLVWRGYPTVAEVGAACR